jgi:hypothetical protein
MCLGRTLSLRGSKARRRVLLVSLRVPCCVACLTSRDRVQLYGQRYWKAGAGNPGSQRPSSPPSPLLTVLQDFGYYVPLVEDIYKETPKYGDKDARWQLP